jgi:hypothetical protein
MKGSDNLKMFFHPVELLGTSTLKTVNALVFIAYGEEVG